MVTRALATLLVSCALLACGKAAPTTEPAALVLRGFRVVDPASHSETEREIIVEGGVIVARASSSKTHVVEGRGRYLMPALWDLRAALWGNNSTKSYDEMSQDMSFSRAMGVQLYYGVAHVGIFGMRRWWAGRMLKRAEALELTEAEPLYPDLGLCGKRAYGCDAVPDPAAARAALDERKRHGVPFVTLTASYLDSDLGETGLRHDVLVEALSGARQRHLPSIVTVADWKQAQEVVALGANVIYGMPEGPLPDALVEQMLERRVAYAPAFGMYLELDHVLGNDKELSDPFLTATVQPAILDTYRSEQGMFGVWRRALTLGRARQASSLAALERLAKAGVHIVVTSDACFAGSFQGHSSHAMQAWFERAGLDGWARLSAATLWPAELLGRQLSFEPGQPADFLALDASPLERAENLRRISLVIRQGKLVDRAQLLPDLTRRDFRP